MGIEIPRLIFGVVLLIIWGVLRFRALPRANPSASVTVGDLDKAVQGAEIRIAFLTVGLLSIALSL